MELNSKSEPQEKAINHDHADFKQVIEESKHTISSEPIKSVRKRRSDAGKARKGSRPAGDSQDTIQTEALRANREGILQTSPAPDISKYLEGPLTLLSKIPAQKHKIPELALSPDEAKACAESINNLVQAFIPDLNNMSPKTAAVVGACLTFGTIYFNKMAIIADKKPKEEKVEPSPEKDFQQQVSESTQFISAQDAFRRNDR